jgi:hypothetical protein
MKPKKLILKKTIISNLNPDQLNSIKGGFDLSDYCTKPASCTPDNQTDNC